MSQTFISRGSTTKDLKVAPVRAVMESTSKFSGRQLTSIECNGKKSFANQRKRGLSRIIGTSADILTYDFPIPPKTGNLNNLRRFSSKKNI